jgi:hypothetical protein
MKQKLIMENWRRFIKKERDKEVLEEGILSTLAGMMLVLNIGGKEVQVELDDVVSGYQQARAEQLDAEASELADILKTAAYNVDTLGDTDGVIELGATGYLDSGTEVLLKDIIDGSDTGEAPQDTGDTGVESANTLNVSIAINQMENAPTKEARNDWAQKILDYDEDMGENSDVPPAVIERAKFYLGK